MRVVWLDSGEVLVVLQPRTDHTSLQHSKPTPAINFPAIATYDGVYKIHLLQIRSPGFAVHNIHSPGRILSATSPLSLVTFAMHLIAIRLTLLISTLAAALPLEGALSPRSLASRTKTYAIVNVDGGTTTTPPKPSTTVEDKTKTVQVTNAPATVTDKVTATTTAIPAPSSNEPSSSSTATSSPKSTPSAPVQETPTPSIVTIIVTESAAPTKYYDDGLWKTSYPVKTFVTATTTVAG